MGLDMYLSIAKKIDTFDDVKQYLELDSFINYENYISKPDTPESKMYTFDEWYWRTPMLTKDEIDEAKKSLGTPDYVFTEVGYWRKANQIHNWFVENVQNGVDDCDAYEVTEDHILKLISVCNKVLLLENNKDELTNDMIDLLDHELPTTEGFFFGSTSYDEYYFDDVRETLGILLHVLDYDLDKHVVVYQSSW